jgi:hypothetical protein
MICDVVMFCAGATAVGGRNGLHLSAGLAERHLQSCPYTEQRWHCWPQHWQLQQTPEGQQQQWKRGTGGWQEQWQSERRRYGTAMIFSAMDVERDVIFNHSWRAHLRCVFKACTLLVNDASIHVLFQELFVNCTSQVFSFTFALMARYDAT